MDYELITSDREKRAYAIKQAGGLENAFIEDLPKRFDCTLSEAIVLGLLRQGVKNYIGIFGHGSTELGEVLRVYEQAGLLKMYNVRNEVEAAHAAAALRWVTGEKAAVVTSIGPGALQAIAGSLTAASDGLGVWFLLGDETTEDEGPNMQQIPKYEQALFLRLCQTMGQAYSVHTPGSISAALRRGLNTVDHPYRQGPFYLLMPMNMQCSMIENFNFDELPAERPPALSGANDTVCDKAINAIENAKRVVVKVGGGCRGAEKELAEFLELADGVAVLSPLVTGVIAYDNPRNMMVGGSKGSLCGNFAMNNADLLVTVGSRAVCQSDSSRTAYPNVERVININGEADTAMHYNRTVPLIGDIKATLATLNGLLRKTDRSNKNSEWFKTCDEQRNQWETFKQARYETPTFYDDVWKREVLTQPAAIKIASDFARHNGAVNFFDAGDVQANGFQIVEDDKLGRTFSDTGASYMGFAASALLAGAMADESFYGMAYCGDGSFMMNPQILIDAVQHDVKGCIVIFDNRRMAAISGLQNAQYGTDYATKDQAEVDYVAMSKAIRGINALFGGHGPDEFKAALKNAYAYDGLSVIHVPVYYGEDELGGMGAFGRWNVGNWCETVQKMRHEIGL